MKQLVFSKEYFPLVLLIIISLVIGAFTLSHYGESWDEFNYLTHAQLSLQAYVGHPPAWDVIYRFYGPSFMMLTVLVGKLFPSVILSDVAHGLSFLTFLAGLAVFFKLARRWLGIWESYGATLLFASQPLLWGHAFINSKDTPFMVGFISSIYLGLRMMDSLKFEPPKQPVAGLKGILHEELKSLTTRRGIFLTFSLILVIAISIWLGNFLATWQAANYPPIFTTADFFNLEHFLYQITSRVGSLGLNLGLILFSCGLVISIHLPVTSHHIYETEFKPLARQVKYALSNRALLAMALIIGFTASIRFLGLVAAGVVGLLFLWRHRQAALVPLAVLAGLSILVMYLFWPYLWPAPFFRFLLTSAVMLRFPWGGKVLFEGQYYAARDLPYYYLPKLIGLQTTETALVCFLLGLLVITYFVIKKRSHLYELAFLSMVWFFLPVFWSVIGDPNLYDNFRQLHFILPPMFIIGGLGLEFIFSKLRRPVLKILIFILLVLPGVFGYLRLFPYEYVYYNSLAGANTFRQYEADYWATSFREASQFINKTAPANAKVVVWGPLMPFLDYARPDISAVGFDVGPIPKEPYYVVISSRYDNHLSIHPDFPVLFRSERNGMILAVVKYIENP